MAYLREVKLANKNIGQYRKFNVEIFQNLIYRSAYLKAKKIVHVSSTNEGGGVAEILKSQVALERALGIDSRWVVIRPREFFFRVTKKIHNGLQGEGSVLSKTEKRIYIEESKRLADGFNIYLDDKKVDLIIIHDPQPLILGSLIPSSIPKILRLHIDLSSPNSSTLNFLNNYLKNYNQVIVSRKDYSLFLPSFVRTTTIMPAIDPLSSKNRKISHQKARQILKKHKIDWQRPIVSQISRFDRWKDPLGTINAYLLAKNKIVGLQLVLVGFLQAKDDPQQQEQLQVLKKYVRQDKDIFIFSDLNQLHGVGNDLFVNAIQTESTIITQKSIREGFGLTVCEAMWKAKAVIGGNAAGIRMQIKNGKNGFIVSNVHEAAEAIVSLSKNKILRDKLGQQAHKTVILEFLITRFLVENLQAYNKLVSKA